MIPKIAKSLIGHKIVGAISGESQDNYGGRKGDGNTTTVLYVPSREAYLKLDNGLILKCWNSEWGGIHILDPNKPLDVYEIDQVNRELTSIKESDE